jgi:Protein of unknown function (DUF2442)
MKDLPTDAEMEAGAARFRETQRGYALSFHYDRDADAFILGLRSGSRLTIPRIALEELRDATSAELDQVVLSHSGGTIRCEPLDIDTSVPGLVRDVTGAADWLARGGSRKTPTKARASRVNGKKGGRPHKKIKAA